MLPYKPEGESQGSVSCFWALGTAGCSPRLAPVTLLSPASELTDAAAVIMHPPRLWNSCTKTCAQGVYSSFKVKLLFIFQNIYFPFVLEPLQWLFLRYFYLLPLDHRHTAVQQWFIKFSFPYFESLSKAWGTWNKSGVFLWVAIENLLSLLKS